MTTDYSQIFSRAQRRRRYRLPDRWRPHDVLPWPVAGYEYERPAESCCQSRAFGLASKYRHLHIAAGYGLLEDRWVGHLTCVDPSGRVVDPGAQPPVVLYVSYVLLPPGGLGLAQARQRFHHGTGWTQEVPPIAPPGFAARLDALYGTERLRQARAEQSASSEGER